MGVWVRTYWKLFFIERRLSEICRANLKDFSLWLVESKKLKAKTINNVLGAGTVALKWAHENDLIVANRPPAYARQERTAAREKCGMRCKERSRSRFPT
jgi:hypothetical protein